MCFSSFTMDNVCLLALTSSSLSSWHIFIIMCFLFNSFNSLLPTMLLLLLLLQQVNDLLLLNFYAQHISSIYYCFCFCFSFCCSLLFNKIFLWTIFTLVGKGMVVKMTEDNNNNNNNIEIHIMTHKLQHVYTFYSLSLSIYISIFSSLRVYIYA